MRKIYPVLIIAVFFSSRVTAQITSIIKPVAGIGVSGYAGDGGPSITAKLTRPAALAIDDTGNLFIADASNVVIRKVSAGGVITTLAGSITGSGGYGDGGPATAARMMKPYGVATDRRGNVYIADADDNRVRKVDTVGKISTVAGTVYGFSGDGGPATAAALADPHCIAVDKWGNIYIGLGFSTVRKIDTSGIIRRFAGTGTSGFGGDGGPATAAQIYLPNGITVDDTGNVYISDAGNSRIRKVDTLGRITTFAGTGAVGFSGDGGPATAALICTPNGLTIDSKRNMYFADEYNHRIRKIDTAGIITTIAGSGLPGTAGGGYSGDYGPAIAALLNGPSGVAVDTGGVVYLSDGNNYAIRKILIGAVALSVNATAATTAPIKLYPNPTTGVFNVEFPKSNNATTITIVDVVGRIVGAKTIKDEVIETFELNNIAPGTYLISVDNGTQKYTGQIVVH